MNRKLIPILTTLLCVAFTAELHAQTNAFTYQGQLTDNGSPANGFFDITFSVWTSTSGPSQVGPTLASNAVPVSDGLFTVTLDFGAGVFDGSERWLEIGVATNGSGVFTNLSPRQPISSTPYAIQAANAANATMAANAASAAAVSGTVAASQLTGTISSNNIGAGSITSVMLAEGSVGTAQLADDAVTSNKVYTTLGGFLDRSIFNPTAQIAGGFGNAVAAVGEDKVLVGAPDDSTSATYAGAAYLFSSGGTLLTTFTNPTPEFADYFGGAVTAVGTNKVVIGTSSDNTGAGAAYLFSTDGTLLTTITNPTPQNYEYFGDAVAAVGVDRVLVGAPDDNTGASAAGAAYLFSTDGTLLTTITNPTPQANDEFGYAVAAVGADKVLIGARGDNAGAANAGAAYLFSTNGTLLTTITNPAPEVGENFGYALAAVGADKVLVGTPFDNTGAAKAGVAYLFSTNGTLLTTITNPTPQANDEFGHAVAAVGADEVLLGTPSDNTGAAGAGSVYLFSTNGALLSTITNPTPQNSEYFGFAVAAVGADSVWVGTPSDNTAASTSGAAYLYRIQNYTPGLVAAGVAPNAITSTEIADGAVGTAQLIPGTTFNGTFAGDGSELTNVPGDNLGDHTATTNLNLNGHWLSGDGDSEGAYVDATGKVGIGTDSPEQEVHVVGNAQIQDGNLEFTTQPAGQLNHAVSTISVALTGGPGATSTNQNIAFKVSDGTQFGNTEVMRLRGDGHVGIGTTTPQARLEVEQTSPEIRLTDGRNDSASGADHDLGKLTWYSRDSSLPVGYDPVASIGVVTDNGTVAPDGRIEFQNGINGILSTTMVVSPGGKVGIGTNAPQQALHVVGNILATGTVTGSSDRNAKENFAPVDTQEILAKVTGLPITTWQYKADQDGERHVGPMAQDFYSAFRVGMDDKHISMVDADGVALAAIQGLNDKSEVRSQKSEARIQKLEAENAELKARLEKIERVLIDKLNGGAK